MASDWSERLRSALEAKGWTVAELARRTGLSKPSLHSYLDARAKQPRGDKIEKLADALGVDALWLRLGLSIERSEGSDALLRLLHSGAVVPLNQLSTLKSFSDLDTLLKNAGKLGSFATSHQVGPRSFFVPIDDDSMAPRYTRGAYVIVDPEASLAPGKSFAFSVQGLGSVVRRVRILGNGKLELHAENPDFPVIKISKPSDVITIGRVVGHLVLD